MRWGATTGARDREINRDTGVSALLPIGNVLKEVFGLSFEACCTEAEGMVLGIGVTVVGMGETTSDAHRQHCTGNSLTR